MFVSVILMYQINECKESHTNQLYIFLNISGCATLMYLNGDKMAVSLSFGKKVITNKTLSSEYDTFA